MKSEYSTNPALFPRRRLLVLRGAILLALAAGSAQGGSLSEKPLFLSVPAPPNVIIGIDDSTSMQAEVVMSYGGNYYDTSGTVGTADSLSILFPDGNHVDPSGKTANIPPLPQYADARSPVTNRAYFDPAFAYTRWTPHGDKVFSDAPPTAAPWDPVSANPAPPPLATLCQSAPPPGFPDKFDLTQDLACADSPAPLGTGKVGGYAFTVGGGVTLPAGTTYWNGTEWVVAPSGGVTLADATSVAVRYFPASFYLPHGFPKPYPSYNGPIATATTLRTYSESDRADLALPSGFAWDGRTWDGYEIRPQNFGDADEYHAAIQNFANWFSYYRKRHAVTRGAIGAAFKNISNLSLGVFKASDAGASPPPDLAMVSLNNAGDAAGVLAQVYGITFDKQTSPSQSVLYLGKQLMRTGPTPPAIIQYACQRNDGIFFTDGFPEIPLADSDRVGNIDGALGAPYADSVADTLADIAMKYYVTNLNSVFPAGKVPVPASCDTPGHDPWLDCQKNLHLNFYGVNLGLKGKQFHPLTSTTRSAYESPMPSWSTVYPDSGLDLQDDFWHATINGRGALLSAARPDEIRGKLLDILNAAVSQPGSGAAVATNSPYLGPDTLVFQSMFDAGDWTGDLVAYQFTSGDVLEPVWRASQNLPAYGDRHIFTSVPQGTYCSKTFGSTGTASVGTVFDWDNLSCVQQTQLNTTLEGQTDALGPDRVNYLKGDTSNEKRNGGVFRDRTDSSGAENLLGDFVHSAPAYAAASALDNFGYSSLPDDPSNANDPYDAERNSYDEFLRSKSERRPMIYVGGNDGMLHAFDASKNSPPGGREVFAYVPAGVYDRLSRLTSPGYNQETHKFFVDGSPSIGDAYLDGKWGTFLVGTTGAGARSLFAIDVTDPDLAVNASFASKTLWDLSGIGASLSNLGYTLARPTIVRTNSGDDRWKWVVIVGNGYNSPNGHAILLVISLKDGTVKYLDTLAGGNVPSGGTVASNGLSTPVAVDMDHNRTVDLAYAGDLLGHVWKFDLRSSDHSKWRVAYGSSAALKPLFSACATHTSTCDEADRQPITSKPEVVAVDASRGGVMIYFGTGKYFEVGDNLVGPSPRVDSFYGLWDRNTLTDADLIGGATLVKQTIESESNTVGGQAVRVTQANPVDYTTKNGWYMDLKLDGGPALGERVVSDPLYHDGRITFSSFAPSSSACATGGSGWIMELDADTGSRPRMGAPIFDLGGANGSGADGHLDSHDLAASGGSSVAPSGIASAGVPSAVRIIQAGEGQVRITGQSGGGSSSSACPDPALCSPERGRQSWQQLR